MERTKLTIALIATCAAGMVAGCGVGDPYQRTTTAQTTPAPSSTSSSTPTATAADSGDPAPERGGTIPASAQTAQDRVSSGAASPTARAAVAQYAALYVNWTAATLVANQRKLAALSIGAARLQAEQAAATASTDTKLTADRVINTGRLVSLGPGTGPAAGKWVVVTNEKTVGQGDYQGLPATVHVTYAAVTRTPQGWLVSQWAPQN